MIISQKPKNRKKLFALVGVCILYLYSMLYTFALPVMYPSMLSQYGLMPYYALFSVISISFSCVFTPLGGMLCDTVGRKKLFLVTGTLRLVLMLLCGIQTSPVTFSVLYLSSSCLTGFMYAIPLTILNDLTALEERPRYFGIFGALTGVSLLSGILLGGIITDLFGPFFMFFLFIPILLSAMILICIGYTDTSTRANSSSLDLLGCLLMLLCLGSLVAWCNFGGSLFSWISPLSFLMLLFVILFFILFLIREKNCSSPLIDLAIFKDRNFDLSFLCGLFIAPMVSLCSSTLILFAQVSLGLSSTLSSTLALPKNIIYLTLPTILGVWISKKYSRYRTAFLWCGLLMVIAGTCSALWTVNTNILTVYLVMIVFGLATSFQSVSLQPYMQLTIPPNRVGIASSLISFSTTLGSTLYSAVYTICYNSRYSISRNVPTALAGSMSQEQLNQLIAPDTLKDLNNLLALRKTVSADMLHLFDETVENLRIACADVFQLMAMITALSGAAIVIFTLILYKKPHLSSQSAITAKAEDK